ncbi:BNR/Asp-box repeat-containing protein [Jiangella sp. DSM 45060]|nr:BNR/Asp-box repeat-containing protein [Jiangella sp. DSM 45060]
MFLSRMRWWRSGRRIAGGGVALAASAALTLTALAGLPSAAAQDDPTDEERLTTMVGWLGADTDPATGPLAQIGGTGGFALDRDRRSVGAFLATPARINRLELTASGSTSTRLAEQDYTLWTSDDNITYQQLTGWSFQASTTDGHPVHTFTNLDTTTRYIKINTRYTDTAHTFVMTNRAADLAVYGTPDDPSQPDEGLTVTDRGVVYDASDSGTDTAFSPAITRAPNGDILVAFKTTGDVQPDGVIKLVRSTDGGQTWSPPETLVEPQIFDGGAMYVSGGNLVTLRDGTILLVFNEGVNYSPYNNRDSKMFVARSTDNGHTWVGLDEPVQLPAEIQREHWACCSRVSELDDGTLMMSLWGTLELADDWELDPQRWRAALVKSYDGGRTWTDYSTIAYDPHIPAGNRGNGSRGGGVNESSVVQLRDGRLMAVIRYEGPVALRPGADPFWLYVSYSEDVGRTWSEPVVSEIRGQAILMGEAPCSASLPEDQTKVMLGHRIMSSAGRSPTPDEPYADLAGVSVSFDGGATWPNRVVLQHPAGLAPGEYRAAQTDFLQLDGNRVLTVFQYQDQKVGPYSLAFNVLQDGTGDECVQEWQNAQEDSQSTLSLHVQRIGLADWPYPLARIHVRLDPSTPVDTLLEQAAGLMTCRQEQARLTVRRNGEDQPIASGQTLEQAGLRTGDVITVNGTEQADGPLVTGHVEYDLFPQTRHVYAWSDTCDYRLPLDSASRSLGLHVEIPDGQAIRSVSLRDTDDTSRLTSDNYTLWASQDNDDYHQITDWSLTTDVIDGRLVHTFTGLSVSEPYLKIHQSHATGTETFVIDSMRDDVDVSFDACPDGHSTETTIAFGAADSGVPNYDRGDGCTFLDQLWAQAPFADHATFVRAVRDLTVTWRTDDLLTRYEAAQVLAAAAQSDITHAPSAQQEAVPR